MLSIDHRFNYSSVALRSPANKTLESIKKIPTSGPSRSPTPPAWLSSANSSHLLSHRFTHLLSLCYLCKLHTSSPHSTWFRKFRNIICVFLSFLPQGQNLRNLETRELHAVSVKNQKRAWDSIVKISPYCYSSKEYKHEYKVCFNLQYVLWMLLLKRFMTLETFSWEQLMKTITKP